MIVASVKTIAPTIDGPLRNPLPPELARYLGEHPAILPDDRSRADYVFAEVDSDGLRERWSDYEANYRGTPRLHAAWVAHLEDAIIHPPHGIVQVGDVIVRETVKDSKSFANTFRQIDQASARMLIKRGSQRFDLTPPVPTQSVGPAFQLGWGLSANYFNWTLRYQSKIVQWQRGGRALKLLAPEPTQRFMSGCLDFFGVPRDAIVNWSEPIRVERLTITSPSARGRYDLSPLITSSLRDHPACRLLHLDEPRPVYVLRGNPDLRTVVNESELVTALEGQGFRIVDAGAHPVWEQVQIFASASMIVSPHGAGLTNIVYSKPDTPIIEIIPEGYDQGVTSYRSLADLFGLKYTAVFAREARPDPKGNPCNSDIVAPIADILAAVTGTAKRIHL